MDVKLPGALNFVTYKEGQSFAVDANSKFNLEVKEVADYCCSYIKE
jgi:uncharacterized protein YaiE (UPF0345 family)